MPSDTETGEEVAEEVSQNVEAEAGIEETQEEGGQDVRQEEEEAGEEVAADGEAEEPQADEGVEQEDNAEGGQEDAAPDGAAEEEGGELAEEAVNAEAGSAAEEEDDEPMQQRKKKKKKKHGGSKFIEEEAEVSSDEEVSADEDVGEDEDVADLIDDTVDEGRSRRKRRRGGRKKKHEALADDDYALVSEALGHQVQRNPDEDVDGDEESDEELKRKRLRLKKPKTRLVVEDLVPVEPVENQQGANEEEDNGEDIGEDDGMYDNDPSALREKELEDEWEKRQRLDLIFEDFEKFMDTIRGQEPEDEDDDPKLDGSDTEESDAEEGSNDKPRPKTQAQIEQEIWRMDCPERLQSRQLKRINLSPEEQEEDIREEAKWIYDHAFEARAPTPWKCSSEAEKEIMENFLRKKKKAAKPIEALDTINSVLTFIRTSKYEIPVIYEYKRDYLGLKASTMDENDLWKIDEWDDKWANMSRRRARLLKMNSKILVCSEERCCCIIGHDSFPEDQKTCSFCTHDVASHTIDSKIEQMTKSASDQVELDDIQDYLKFIQLMEEINLEDADDENNAKLKKGARKRVVPNTLQAVNRLSKVTGLKALVARLGISARQFGENLYTSYSQHKPPPLNEDLNELATDLIGPKLPNPEAVLRAVRRVASSQIINDPLVRQTIRKKWAENAVVSTFPTTKGAREINWAHKYFEVKRIVQKPVPLFSGSLFVKLIQAAKEGFLTYSIFIPPKNKSTNNNSNSVLPDANAPDWFLDDLKEFYCDFGLSLVDDFRSQILKDAVGSLYRMSKTFCEAKLMAGSSKAVIKEARKNFEKDHLLFIKYEGDNKNDKLEKFNIVSCVMGEEDEPTVFVLLNRYGDVVDHLALHFLKTRLDPRIEDPTAQLGYKRKKQEIKFFEDFIRSSDPSLMILDASSLKALDFKKELRTQGLFKGAIEFVNPVLGKVFAKSERAEREFKEFTPLLRQAISMGRLILDPISELAGFWYQDEEAQRSDNSNSREILHLNLHPMQTMVSPAALLQSLERSFVRIVNYVGLDINKVVNRPHLQSTAQFICGLGPVKAKRLLANVMQTGYQGNRASLAPTPVSSGEVDENQLTQAVYENCAGFIIIIGNSSTKDNDVRITPLDSMRIHPDWYPNAQRIAIDAMEATIDEEDDEDTQMENTIQVIEEAMEPGNHQRVLNLNLEAFAVSLEEEEMAGKWGEALQQMASELCGTPGFSDREKLFEKDGNMPFTALTGEPLFEALTGETSSTLRDKQLITVTIFQVKPFGAICRLASGLRGEIRLAELSDKGGFDGFNNQGRENRDLEYVESIVSKGQTLQARILKIEKDVSRYGVQLSCKSSQVRADVDEDYEKNFALVRPDIPEDHRYYMYSGIHPDDAKLMEDTNSKLARTFIPRPISHYLFKNVSRKEACAYLSSRKQGDFVIRPSSLGPTHLTVTWKVVDIEPQVFFHIDVKEEDQPPNLGVGARLLIGDQVFEDLDEIVHRFVEPMVTFSNDMVGFEKFCFGAAEDVRMVLEEEKKLQPAVVPYCVSASEERPGYFIFSYIGNVHVRQEYIKLTPEGFQFKHKTLTEPRALCARIKEHLRREASRSTSRGSRNVPPPPPGRPPSRHSSSSHRPSSSSSSHSSHRSSHHSSHGKQEQKHRSKSDPRVKAEPLERITLRAPGSTTANIGMDF